MHDAKTKRTKNLPQADDKRSILHIPCASSDVLAHVDALPCVGGIHNREENTNAFPGHLTLLCIMSKREMRGEQKKGRGKDELEHEHHSD